VSDDSLEQSLAERLTRAARAAQTLSETLWEALHEELADPRSERVAELSERLADVSIVVASLARVDARRSPPSPAAPPAVSEADNPAPGRGGEPRGPGGGRHDPDRGPEAVRPAILVDELAHVTGVSEEPPLAPGPLARATPQIEIRDERGEEGPAAWIGSIGRRLERHEQDGDPFAVLLVELVELVDAEHPRHAEPLGEASALASQVEDALARELRPADSLTRESPGRYWLLVPRTDGRSARMLAERLARTVRSSASHRGTPLEVAVGIAVCPDDGRQASALAAHADVELYAARAAGRSSD